MNRRRCGALVVLGLTVALVGCVIAPAKELPVRLARAVDENNRGEHSFAQGDLKGAAEHFRRALRAAESIEDEDAIAANLVNLSVVQQRMGEHDAAVAGVERVLRDSDLRFSQRRLAEAALRRGLLALEAQDEPTARLYAQRAQDECPRPCALHAKLLTLRGYLALARSDGMLAEALAYEAITAHRTAGDQEELANALRLAGAATMLIGDPRRGIAPIEEALAIDKRLGLSRAIANDLIAGARLYETLGEFEQARSRYQRALAVAEADGNTVAAADARASLARVGQKDRAAVR